MRGWIRHRFWARGFCALIVCAVVAMSLAPGCASETPGDNPPSAGQMPHSAHGTGTENPPMYNLLANLDPAASLTGLEAGEEWATHARHGYQLHYLRQDLLGARAEYDASLALDPGHYRVWLLRAICRLEMGDAPGADADAHLGLGLAPRSPEALTVAGMVVAIVGDPLWAIALLEEAIALEPGNYWALGVLAEVLAMGPPAVRDFSRAVACARLAVELTGGRLPRFLHTLAHAYAGRGLQAGTAGGGDLYLAAELARQAATAAPEVPAYRASWERFQRAFDVYRGALEVDPPWLDPNWPAAPVFVATPPRFDGNRTRPHGFDPVAAERR